MDHQLGVFKKLCKIIHLPYLFALIRFLVDNIAHRTFSISNLWVTHLLLVENVLIMVLYPFSTIFQGI